MMGTVALVVAIANAVVLRGGGARIAPAESVPSAPVIVVLGAGIHPDGTPTEILADRLATAADLYRAGRAPRILCSGDHGHASHDETGVMARWLEAQGIPPEAIFLDHAGFDSWNLPCQLRSGEAA
jgi:vancomycin permeability regulator SanA